jgi:hypothetical protein
MMYSENHRTHPNTQYGKTWNIFLTLEEVVGTVPSVSKEKLIEIIIGGKCFSPYIDLLTCDKQDAAQPFLGRQCYLSHSLVPTPSQMNPVYSLLPN